MQRILLNVLAWDFRQSAKLNGAIFGALDHLGSVSGGCVVQWDLWKSCFV